MYIILDRFLPISSDLRPVHAFFGGEEKSKVKFGGGKDCDEIELLSKLSLSCVNTRVDWVDGRGGVVN